MKMYGKYLITFSLLIFFVSISFIFTMFYYDEILSLNEEETIDKWNVYFSSAKESESSDIFAKNGFDVSTNNISFMVNLEKNKTYEFNAVIENSGTFDVKVKNLSLLGLEEYSDYFNYIITGISDDDILQPGNSAVLTVTIVFDDSKELPDELNNGLLLELNVACDFVEA